MSLLPGIKASLYCLLGLWCGTAMCQLTESGDSPVDWKAAGEVTMRSENGIRIIEMSEQVEVTQGSIVVHGDHAIFEYAADTGKLLRATVNGTPVRYRQQLAGDNDDGAIVSGASETLVLYEDTMTGQTMIEMLGQASITTPDSNMACAAILYNTSQNLIPSSTGPCDGSLTTPSNP